MRALIIPLLAFVPMLVPALARAQQGFRGVPIGSRVRVTSTSLRVERWVTRLEAASGDTMYFLQREGAPYAIPVRLIDRLEVSDGIRYSRGARALHVSLGYAGGFIGGSAIGAAMRAEPDETLKGAAILGVFTAILAYREPTLGRGEQWRRIPLPVAVGLAPFGSGLAIVVSIEH